MNARPEVHSDNTASPESLDAIVLVPSAWLRFLYRVAGLERGRIYTITLVIPATDATEPQWAIQSAGLIENGHRLGK